MTHPTTDCALLNKTLGWEFLHYAVYTNDINLAKTLITEHVDVNSVDFFNRTPLSIAAATNNLQFLQFLIDHNADVDLGFPLHYACEQGFYDGITYLIQNSADVNLVKDHNFPILIAAAKGFDKIVQLLADRGADVNVLNEIGSNALHLSCTAGHINVSKLLMAHGCNVNTVNRYDQTPLLCSLLFDQSSSEVVKLLLEYGASVEEDPLGRTPLHYCSNATSAQHLIDEGVELDQQDRSGETALYALLSSREFPPKVLLDRGADPNISIPGGLTPLHVACHMQDTESVTELLQNGANVNAVNAQNVTPLHLAVQKDNFSIVQTLIEHGAFVNVPGVALSDVNSSESSFLDKTDDVTPVDLAKSDKVTALLNIADEPHELLGWTPLHYAVYKNNYPDCEKLLKGDFINQVDNFGRTPLCIAAAKNNVVIAKLLRQNGADVNLGQPIHYAVAQSSMECLEELLQTDACLRNTKNKTFWENTPLIEAASSAKPAIVKILLEHGCDPNYRNRLGEVPLQTSVTFDDFEASCLLLQHGANVNNVDNLQDTPLINATQNANAKTIELLLEHGANVNVQDYSLYTPLHRAVASYKTGSEKCFRTIIDKSDGINSSNWNCDSPLFLAADNVECMKILLENGADASYRASGGWCALHESCYNGNLECVEELIKYGVKINDGSAENVLPIYLAAIGGHLTIIHLLVSHGSFIDPVIVNVGTIREEKNYNMVVGNTPLIGAASKGHLDIVKFLIDQGASITCQNREGNTAVHEAIIRKKEAIIEYFASKIDEVGEIKNSKGETVRSLLTGFKVL